ncbi:MAG: reverse transcriptase domain-containing protein [Chthoniobacter sp.]|nr:reverse transcriptase domain-containing protein [Chthoniobacter sp.]
MAAAAAAAAAAQDHAADSSSVVASDSSQTRAQQRHDDDDEEHRSGVRGAFRAPSTIPLDPEDFPGWATQMEALLDYGGMWPLRSPGAPGETEYHRSSMREAYFILTNALRCKESRRVLTGLSAPRDPAALWLALQRRFTHMPRAAAAALYARLFQQRQEPGETVRAFADRLAVMRQQLEANGRKVSNEDAIAAFAAGVQPALAHQVSAYVNLGESITLEQAVEVARGEEVRLQLSHAAAVGKSAAAPTALGGHSSGAHTNLLAATHSSSVGCHACGKVGHFAAECPSRAAHRGGGPPSNRAQRTASPQEVAAGACPRPGHKTHKASECRLGPVHSSSASVASTSSFAPAGHTIVSMGVAEVSLRTAAVEPAARSRAAATQQVHADTHPPARAPVVLDSGAGRTVVPRSGVLIGAEAAPEMLITVANGEVLSSPQRGTAVIHAAGATALHVRNALRHEEIDRTLLSVHSALSGGAVEEIRFRAGGAVAVAPGGALVFTATQVNGIYLLDTDDRQSSNVATAFSLGASESSSSSAAAAAPALAPTQGTDSTSTQTCGISETAQLLHERCCHRFYGALQQAASSGAVIGFEGFVMPSATALAAHRCAGCAAGKGHRLPFGAQLHSSRTAQHVLAIVDADVAGPISIPSLGGARYFLVLLDEFSEFASVCFLAHKSDAAAAIIDWCRRARTRQGRSVVEFHTDGGGEFLSAALQQEFRRQGIEHTSTVRDTPQHDGKSERLIRTLAEWANAALIHAGAPRLFWSYAVATAAFVRNFTQLCKLPASSSAPGAPVTARGRWFSLPPASVDISRFRVFGCDADVVFTSGVAKLEPKSRLCMFLGFDEAKNDAWRFFDPQRRVVITARDATFHERSFTVARAERASELAANDGGDDIEEDQEWLTRVTWDNETKLVAIASRELAQQAAERQAPSADTENELEEPAATPPSRSASSDSESGEVPAADSPTPAHSRGRGTRRIAHKAHAVGGVRRSTRESVRPNYYGMENGNLAQAHSVRLLITRVHFVGLALQLAGRSAAEGPPAVPRSYTEAMQSPEWRAAIASELASHASNGTWKFARLPPGAKAIGSKYVFKIKLAADGTIERYKVRLTAQGFSQVEGRDYTETYAPVLSYHTLRALLAFVAAEDYELHQMDVETAYLNAYVTDAVIYMRVPEGVEAPPGCVLRLRKALYGTKQAGAAWHAEIRGTLLRTLGYTSSEHDACLFTRLSRTGRKLLFPLFVDDCFPACATADLAELRADEEKLCSIYKIKHSGDATLLLGMRVTRDRAARTIRLDQQVYTERLLADYGATNARPASTPELATNTRHTNAGGDRAQQEAQEKEEETLPANIANEVSYSALVGSLQYAALATRPDIAHAVNSLARGLSAPTANHRAAAWRVLRYLAGTPSLGLLFGGAPSSRPLVAYSDANWAGPDGNNDGTSTSGWIVRIGTGPVSWCSKKQTMVALSSMESEYVAASLACQEVVHVRGLLSDFGVAGLGEATALFCDNTAAEQLANGSRISQRSKHINVRYHYIRSCVAEGIVAVRWIRTTEQPADALTKALGPQQFHRIRPFLLGEAEKVEGGTASF